MSRYHHFIANDGTKLAYQSHGKDGARNCIILIHGFSGSSEYFCRNYATLSRKHRVIGVDLRGHGQSEHTKHGHHVSRLAADLHDLLLHLRQEQHEQAYIGVGCSIGAACLWLYAELFTCKDWKRMVFVDQAPMQNRAYDWELANYGCYDSASLEAFQKELRSDLAEAARGLVRGCLGYRYEPKESDEVSQTQRSSDESFFTNITTSCDGNWLALLMADHTSYDHRETISQLIDVPTLVCAGSRSGCFPLAGMLWTFEAIASRSANIAHKLVFDSGHWLYFEEADLFNETLLKFIETES